MKRRRFLGQMLLGAGMGALGGCRLGQSVSERRSFLMEVPQSGVGLGETIRSGTGVLLVRPFRVAAAYDSQSLVIRLGPSEYVRDPQHSFLVAPGVMITDLVAEWMRGQGRYQVVSTGGSQATATEVLEGEITELHGDYRDRAEPKAVLELRLRRLTAVERGGWKLLGEQKLRVEEPMPMAEATALVSGWNRALARVLEDWVRSEVD
jgi:ABC-type uncharacterized transport system auxiliary subunit